VTIPEPTVPEQIPAGPQTRPALEAAVPAALRDANAIAARITADEQAADAERVRLADGILPVVSDQASQQFQLLPDEAVHAVRPSALLEDAASEVPSGGTLYLTSHRLVHVGHQVREISLDSITEIAVALERLLLVDLADGSDLAIEVDQPRLLRVQLAAARVAAREQVA
jgi:hypothetical protein